MGSYSSEFYIDKLKSNSLFEISIDQKKQLVNIEVYGPKKEHQKEDLKELKAQFAQRAKALGLFAPKIVNSAAKNVYYAELAERIILISRLYIKMPIQINMTRAEVTLEAKEEGGINVKNLLEYYANWRITCLAQALEMEIEGVIYRL